MSVCHAEMNAIMNKNTHDISGSTLYTTHFPCNECAKLIVQARITQVVYLHHKKPKVSETALWIQRVSN